MTVNNDVVGFTRNPAFFEDVYIAGSQVFTTHITYVATDQITKDFDYVREMVFIRKRATSTLPVGTFASRNTWNQYILSVQLGGGAAGVMDLLSDLDNNAIPVVHVDPITGVKRLDDSGMDQVDFGSIRLALGSLWLENTRISAGYEFLTVKNADGSLNAILTSKVGDDNATRVKIDAEDFTSVFSSRADTVVPTPFEIVSRTNFDAFTTSVTVTPASAGTLLLRLHQGVDQSGPKVYYESHIVTQAEVGQPKTFELKNPYILRANTVVFVGVEGVDLMGGVPTDGHLFDAGYTDPAPAYSAHYNLVEFKEVADKDYVSLHKHAEVINRVMANNEVIILPLDPPTANPTVLGNFLTAQPNQAKGLVESDNTYAFEDFSTRDDLKGELTLSADNGDGTGTLTRTVGVWNASDVHKHILLSTGNKFYITVVTNPTTVQGTFTNMMANPIAEADWTMHAMEFTNSDLKLSTLSTAVTPANVYNPNSLAANTVGLISTLGVAANSDFSFSSDGKYVYLPGITLLVQHELNTAFDLTAGLANSSSPFAYLMGLFPTANQIFSATTSEDGSLGILLLNIGSDKILAFVDLSVAFRFESGFNPRLDLDLTATTSGENILSSRFNHNGMFLYAAGAGTFLYQFTLSSAYDTSTITATNIMQLAGNDNYVALNVSRDGRNIIAGGLLNEGLSYIHMDTPYDATTISTNVTGIGQQDDEPTLVAGTAFNADGTRLFISSNVQAGKIREYELTTITLASPVNQWYSLATLEPYDTHTWLDLLTIRGIGSYGEGQMMMAISTDDQGLVYSIRRAALGLRNIVKLSGGEPSVWQVNQNVDYALETWVDATGDDRLTAMTEAMAFDINQMPALDDYTTATEQYATGDVLNILLSVNLPTGSSTTPELTQLNTTFDDSPLTGMLVPGTDYSYEQLNGEREVSFQALRAGTFSIKVI